MTSPGGYVSRKKETKKDDAMVLRDWCCGSFDVLLPTVCCVNNVLFVVVAMLSNFAVYFDFRLRLGFRETTRLYVT